jgi:hypothetical protein
LASGDGRPAAGSRLCPEAHLFEAAASEALWSDHDAAFASQLPRTTLEAAVAGVPDAFLAPMLPAQADLARGEALRRRRAAYVAYLWKRLQPPRAFATAGPTPIETRPRGKRPDWLG